MSTNQKDGLLRVADSAPPVEMEIFYRDGDGKEHSFIAIGRLGFNRAPAFCEGHFIAHGVCIDCSRQLGETVWAS
jgi:hypothetical protein